MVIEGGPAPARVARVAVVGISTRPVCGVRDHATLLAEALDSEGVRCTLHWLSRPQEPLPAARSRIRAWAGGLAAALEGERPDAILLHYSAFAYSHRGIPLFVHPALAPLRAARVPVVTVMHELVYPWRRGGLRGGVWAMTQRVALVEVVRASAAVLLTTDLNANWLQTRRWLPRRPVATAPVFSNLPRSRATPAGDRAVPLLGLFGYTLDPVTVALVTDALRTLGEQSVRAELALLGAPGPHSSVADGWQAAAAYRGVASALSFSGTLPAQELADALASCDVLVYADAMGPAARKGTLAASLASGRPLVAMEGRRRWEELLRADAARVVPRTAAALAETIEVLLADASAREQLGERGRAFAEQTMGVTRTAAAVRGLLTEVHRGAG